MQGVYWLFVACNAAASCLITHLYFGLVLNEAAKLTTTFTTRTLCTTESVRQNYCFLKLIYSKILVVLVIWKNTSRLLN